MLQWCDDLFWQECLHMHLVNWVEAVTLSRNAEVDALVPPFLVGEMVAPGAYYDTLPQVPQCTLVSSQPGYIY